MYESHGNRNVDLYNNPDCCLLLTELNLKYCEMTPIIKNNDEGLISCD